MIFTHQSKLTSEQVEERIEEEAKEIGLMLKKHFPFSQNLPQSGFEINEHVSIFEFCKPSLAAKVLNIQPELSILLPCRISVFEKEGASFISTTDIDFALRIIGCKDELKKEISDLYENITSMIKKF